MTEIIKLKQCPICHKSFTDDKYRPFCSKRCADIDLGNWFNGNYRFAAEEVDEQDAEEIAKLRSEPTPSSEE